MHAAGYLADLEVDTYCWWVLLDPHIQVGECHSLALAAAAAAADAAAAAGTVAAATAAVDHHHTAVGVAHLHLGRPPLQVGGMHLLVGNLAEIAAVGHIAGHPVGTCSCQLPDVSSS